MIYKEVIMTLKEQLSLKDDQYNDREIYYQSELSAKNAQIKALIQQLADKDEQIKVLTTWWQQEG